MAFSKKIGDATKNKFSWSWKGQATTLPELANPTVATNYRVCVYDSTNTLLFNIGVPAGGTCGTKPCWKTTKYGFAYKNKAATPDGAVAFVVKSGIDGKASVKVAAKTASLAMPSFPPVALPVVAQVINTSNNTCFTATFSLPSTDPTDQKRWKAKND